MPAAPASRAPTDSDDALALGAQPTALGGVADIGDGLRLTSALDAATLRAGQAVELSFQLVDAAGQPQPIDPYLGMPAHAVVNRRDGSVFIHLHPMGTVSMAAQQAFALRDRGDTIAGGRLDPAKVGALGAMTMGAPDGRARFVYEFPKSGAYRIWVQVKHGGKIQTGVFDAEVSSVVPSDR